MKFHLGEINNLILNCFFSAAYKWWFTHFVVKIYQSPFTRFWGKILISSFHLCKTIDIMQLCPPIGSSSEVLLKDLLLKIILNSIAFNCPKFLQALRILLTPWDWNETTTWDCDPDRLHHSLFSGTDQENWLRGGWGLDGLFSVAHPAMKTKKENLVIGNLRKCCCSHKAGRSC